MCVRYFPTVVLYPLLLLTFLVAFGVAACWKNLRFHAALAVAAVGWQLVFDVKLFFQIK